MIKNFELNDAVCRLLASTQHVWSLDLTLLKPAVPASDCWLAVDGAYKLNLQLAHQANSFYKWLKAIFNFGLQQRYRKE
eukprot:1160828-Pelagomonas_calceolata.AAC.1